MNSEEILSLIKYRLEQAQTALEDGKFLLEGRRSPHPKHRQPGLLCNVLHNWGLAFLNNSA